MCWDLVDICDGCVEMLSQELGCWRIGEKIRGEKRRSDMSVVACRVCEQDLLGLL